MLRWASQVHSAGRRIISFPCGNGKEKGEAKGSVILLFLALQIGFFGY
jgi:hypothetical protein